MDAVTVTFLVIGGVGVAVLAISLLVGDLFHIGHPDVDGPFSIPAVAGFVGAFGFAGALAARLVPGPAPSVFAATLVGLIAAVPMAWLASRMARMAMDMRTDATPTLADRAAFASAVAEEAEHSLTNQGLVLDTFQLQDIFAEGSYLADLGRPEAARVLKEAAIAEAQARQAAESERLKEAAIAEANRNLALKQAGIQAEIDAARARSAAAGPLAQAERDQAILAEQQKVAERNAELKQRQLDTEVRKPTDAARYRVEQEAEAAKNAAILKAEAQRQATIAAAQASAEQARLTGEGERSRRAALAEANAIEGAKEGEAEQRRRVAIADALEREGAAEACAILARGEAEADAMRRKAEAFAEYGEAAVLDLLVRVLPEIVKAASEPIGNIDKMTVISTDGASSISKSIAGNVAQGMQLGTDLTGIDLRKLLARLGGEAVEEDGGGTRKAPAVTASEKPKR